MSTGARTRRPFPARRLLLCAGGSVACAHLPFWVSWIRQTFDLEVRLLLTRRAESLVSAVSLGALSGHPVQLDREDAAALQRIPHHDLAAWPDAVLVAPATANLLAKAAQGVADNMLLTVLLATEAPVAFAPSLTPAMLAKPAVRRNLDTLYADGHVIIDPQRGLAAAEGVEADGAMADPVVAMAALKRFLEPTKARAA
jgi:phosphopantothenoylcysteine decarboxylase/phosphopantothenate--cysteine ligase